MSGDFLFLFYSMQKNKLAIAASLMAIAVILGALGAHALSAILTEGQLLSFKTGVRYQAWHALAIFIVQLIPENIITAKAKNGISNLFILGIVFFSFSIYLLSMRDLIGLGSAAGILGPITPIGGLLLIAGWAWLTVSIIKR